MTLTRERRHAIGYSIVILVALTLPLGISWRIEVLALAAALLALGPPR